MFIIQSGEVEIRFGNRVLDTLPQFSIFGEMALIGNAPRSATAIAASDLKLVSDSEKQFLFLISNTPYFALNVMRTMRGVCAQRTPPCNYEVAGSRCPKRPPSRIFMFIHSWPGPFDLEVDCVVAA